MREAIEGSLRAAETVFLRAAILCIAFSSAGVGSIGQRVMRGGHAFEVCGIRVTRRQKVYMYQLGVQVVCNIGAYQPNFVARRCASQTADSNR
jgi:hypothetical protein